MTLSTNAQMLLSAIKNNSLWEQDAIKVLFPAPVYTKETAAAYWQWDVNLYGNPNSRPVNGESVFFTPTANYADITQSAVKELKAQDLIRSANNGYNDYAYHYTGK